MKYSVGNRIPSIYQFPYDTALYVGYYINDNWSKYFKTQKMTEDWFNLKIEQAETSDGFKYSITIDDKQVFTVINKTPKAFKNVEASFCRIKDDKNYRAADGWYQNLQILSQLSTLLITFDDWFSSSLADTTTLEENCACFSLAKSLFYWNQETTLCC